MVLSTGVDTSSTKQIQDLLQRVKTSDVRIMAVSLTGNLRNPPAAGKKKTPPAKAALSAQQFAEADMLLRQIAESTGGLAYFPATSNELPAIFAQIAKSCAMNSAWPLLRQSRMAQFTRSKCTSPLTRPPSQPATYPPRQLHRIIVWITAVLTRRRRPPIPD